MKSISPFGNIRLEWKCTVPGFVSLAEARVTSCARTSNYLKIEYEGWVKDESKSFSGQVTVPLSTEEHETKGEGALGSAPVPYRLVGAFQNDECTIYEGTWYEDPGYTATFSFDASV